MYDREPLTALDRIIILSILLVSASIALLGMCSLVFVITNIFPTFVAWIKEVPTQIDRAVWIIVVSLVLVLRKASRR